MVNISEFSKNLTQILLTIFNQQPVNSNRYEIYQCTKNNIDMELSIDHENNIRIDNVDYPLSILNINNKYLVKTHGMSHFRSFEQRIYNADGEPLWLNTSKLDALDGLLKGFLK